MIFTSLVATEAALLFSFLWSVAQVAAVEAIACATPGAQLACKS